jgi:hypothetical protein
VKKDDHAMDALRYGLMHLFKLGANYHLEDVSTKQSGAATASGSLQGAEGIFTMAGKF